MKITHLTHKDGSYAEVRKELAPDEAGNRRFEVEILSGKGHHAPRSSGERQELARKKSLPRVYIWTLGISAR